MHLSLSHAFRWSTINKKVLYSSSLLVQEGVSFCLEGIIFSQSIMPQLDKFTYFTQFFWSCLFLFTFYIAICNDGDGLLGISRIVKLYKSPYFATVTNAYPVQIISPTHDVNKTRHENQSAGRESRANY